MLLKCSETADLLHSAVYYLMLKFEALGWQDLMNEFQLPLGDWYPNKNKLRHRGGCWLCLKMFFFGEIPRNKRWGKRMLPAPVEGVGWKKKIIWKAGRSLESVQVISRFLGRLCRKFMVQGFGDIDWFLTNEPPVVRWYVLFHPTSFCKYRHFVYML